MAKIILYASNAIGKSMAGPAIRTWEFAKTLRQEHEVVIIAPKVVDMVGEGFTLISQNDPSASYHLKTADVLIAQTLSFSMAWKAKFYQLKIILDAYDPVPLEFLELFKEFPLKYRLMQNTLASLHLNFNFKMADTIVCASEKQRDLWIGLLLAHRRLLPNLYDTDSSMRHLVDVVPFGLPSKPAQKTKEGLRAKYGFKDSDKIVLWGGGIWNWFDPLSLIEAFHLLKQSHPHIKLVFMGIKNPDEKVPEMSMCAKAIQLAKQLNLIDHSVFFNYGWVPYDERQNFLLDADVGSSTHFDHLETRYSFRTRMLDYIWAQLPILATEGDSFAELIQQHQLGIVVPYRDPQAIAKAILDLTENECLIKTIKANLAQMNQKFYWETITQPIKRMVNDLSSQTAYRLNYKDILVFCRSIGQYARIKIWNKLIKPCLVSIRNTLFYRTRKTSS